MPTRLHMAYNYSTPPDQVIQQDDIEIEDLQKDLIKKRLDCQNLSKNTVKADCLNSIDEYFKLEFNKESLKLIVVAGNNEDTTATPVENEYLSNMDHNQLFYSDLSSEESDLDTHLDFSEKYKRCIHSTPTPQVSYKSDSRKCSISSDLSVDTLISKQNYNENFLSSLQSYKTTNNLKSFQSFWQNCGYNDNFIKPASNIKKRRKLRNDNSESLKNLPRLQSPILFSKKD